MKDDYYIVLKGKERDAYLGKIPTFEDLERRENDLAEREDHLQYIERFHRFLINYGTAENNKLVDKFIKRTFDSRVDWNMMELFSFFKAIELNEKDYTAKRQTIENYKAKIRKSTARKILKWIGAVK